MDQAYFERKLLKQEYTTMNEEEDQKQDYKSLRIVL